MKSYPAHQRAFHWTLAALTLLLPFSTACGELLFFAIAVIWWAELLRSRQKPTWFLKPAWPAGIWTLSFLLIGLASVFYSISMEHSWAGWFRKWLEYVLFFVLIADLESKYPSPKPMLLKVFYAMTGVMALQCLIQFLIIVTSSGVSTFDPFTGVQFLHGRIIGPFRNPNNLGAWSMAVTLIAGVVGSRVPERRWLHLSIAGVGFIGILLTHSLSALLATLCAMVAYFLLIYRTKKTLALLGITFALAVIAILWIEPRPLEAFSLQDIGSQQRLGTWKTAWLMIQEKPWFGHGLNTFIYNYHNYAPPTQMSIYAHNCYLQMIAEVGFVGFSTFVALMVFVLEKARRVALATSNRITQITLFALWTALVGYLIQATFDTHFYALRQAVLFWSMLGLLYGTTLTEQLQNRAQETA